VARTSRNVQKYTVYGRSVRPSVGTLYGRSVRPSVGVQQVCTAGIAGCTEVYSRSVRQVVRSTDGVRQVYSNVRRASRCRGQGDLGTVGCRGGGAVDTLRTGDALARAGSRVFTPTGARQMG